MKKNLLVTRSIGLLALTICVLLQSCDKGSGSLPFTVDESASAMEWKGYLKDGSGNNGTIKVSGQLLVNDKNQITGGHITLPLSSLISINLPTDELKAQLIHHLQSADFFDMAAHPEIVFKIISLTPDTDLPGSYQAFGELTILGKTNPVRFTVKVNFTEKSVEVTGATRLDRTLWGMRYATDENTADSMYVKPGIDVQFRLVATEH
ncbi:YceI family protein [Dyadobacter luteus]|nr:YceI family protein [Dyadobacter luteus]